MRLRTVLDCTRRWGGIVLLAGGSLVCGCATSGEDKESGSTSRQSSDVLRVGVTPTMPPMVFKRSRDFAGFEVDVAREFAGHLGKAVEFVEVPWSDQIDALLGGRIDIIMSNMSITPARAIRINFSTPYLRGGQSALVRRSDAAAIRVTLFSDKLRVGVQKATTGDYFTQQHLPRADHVTFKNAAEGARALIRERIDVLIHDAPVNWWLASQHETEGLTVLPVVLTEEYLAWGVRKDDAKLLADANDFIASANENGQLQAAIDRWLPNWR